MKIHHIGYLVKDIEKASEEFIRLGFLKQGDAVEDTDRGVLIVFLENGGYKIELVQVVDEISPMYRLYKKHGNSPYHICYETSNLPLEIERMTGGADFVLLQPPSPAPAISGREVAFLVSKNIGLVELLG